jgi:hypothetical protein
MSNTPENGLTPNGDPAYCTDCEAPLVVYESTNHGYQIVCCCSNTSVDINNAASNSNLFTPMTGKWSNIDDIDPWDDIDL